MPDELKLAKYAAIFQDLTAGDIMVAHVAALSAEKKVAHAKEMMKIKKISGLPVVDEKRRVIGIISIEDIINALEFHRMNEPLRNFMSSEVVAVGIDEPLAELVAKFENYGFGRFPVVDSNGVLRGIVTKEDVLHGILDRFNLIYVHDHKRNMTLDSDHSLITGETLKSSEAEFHFHIDGSDIHAAGTGAALLKKFLQSKQFDADTSRRVGVATYEAETNVVIHSKGIGDIYGFLYDEGRIIVRVVDNGIGIEDLEKAMKEGYSTAPDYVRELGFGAGMGLANMKRFSDKLVVLSEKNVGTQVEMVFFIPNQPMPLM